MRNYRVNCDKIAETLPAFEPQWTVRRGVEELYDAYLRERARRSTTSRARASCASSTSRSCRRGRARRRPALAAHRRRVPERRRRRPAAPACADDRRAAAPAAPTARRSSSTLGETAARRTRCVRPGRARTGPRPRYPARRRLLPGVLARADPRGGAAGGSCSSTTTSTSRRSPTACCGTAREHALRADRDARARRRTASSSSSPERRLPAEELRRARRSRCSASTRRPTRPTAAERGRRPDPARSSSAPTSPGGCVAEGKRGRRDHRQQRDGAHAGPQRLRRGASRILLADDGVATIENPYVKDLIDHCEFDTIYHEHFCYFSCTAVDALMRRHGLYLERTSSTSRLHGGTLRWHLGRTRRTSRTRPRAFLARRARARGSTDFGYYARFGGAGRAASATDLLELLAAEGARARRSPPTARRPRAARCQLRRHRHRPRRLRRRPQRAQAGPAHARHAPSRSATRRRCSRSSPTTCCCSPGTSRDEIMRAAGGVPRRRRPLHRPGPRAADRMSAVDTAPVRSPRARRPACPSCGAPRAGALPRAARRPGPQLPARRRRARRRSPSRAATCGSRFCAACGFITNTAFDACAAGLRRRLRGDAGLLARASASSSQRPRRALGRALRPARQGACSRSAAARASSSSTMCEPGGNRGVGIDPAFVGSGSTAPPPTGSASSRTSTTAATARSTRDAVVCRHTLEHIAPVGRVHARHPRARSATGDDTVVLFELPGRRARPAGGRVLGRLLRALLLLHARLARPAVPALRLRGPRARARLRRPVPPDRGASGRRRRA